MQKYKKKTHRTIICLKKQRVDAWQFKLYHQLPSLSVFVVCARWQKYKLIFLQMSVPANRHVCFFMNE